MHPFPGCTSCRTGLKKPFGSRINLGLRRDRTALVCPSRDVLTDRTPQPMPECITSKAGPSSTLKPPKLLHRCHKTRLPDPWGINKANNKEEQIEKLARLGAVFRTRFIKVSLGNIICRGTQHTNGVQGHTSRP